MSYITPNSDIWILQGVPLEENYTHTYFPWDLTNNREGSRTTQFNMMMNYLKPATVCRGKTYSFHQTNYSYLRRDRNAIRVKIPYDILYDCNYLVFKNTSYENKYFYAFIDSIEYINDNNSTIYYTIDVMQTWHFDYILNQCFVEREHSATDIRGENILAEPIDCGEYNISHRFNLLNYLNTESWYIVFVVTFNDQYPLKSADGGFSGGTWNQCDYRTYKIYNPNNPSDSTVKTPDEINTDLDVWFTAVTLSLRVNGIVTVYMCPEPLLPQTIYGKNYSDVYGMPFSISDAHVDTIDVNARPIYPNWTPNNKKLLTYPYCFFTVDNNEGVMKEFKYEYFTKCKTGNTISTGDIEFEVYSGNAVKPRIRIVPQSYMDTTLYTNSKNYEYSIDIEDFAIGTWSTNDFIAKVVQAGIGLAITAATLGTANIAPGVTSFINSGQSKGAEIVRQGMLDHYISTHDPVAAKYDYGFSDNSEMIETLKNQQTGTPKDWAGLGKDFVKTTGALALLALRSKISSSVGNGNINLISGCFDYILCARHVDVRLAQKIDAYFDMYGYQTNTVKLPNRAVRPKWTYTKTTNCTVEGNIPHEDISLIQDIYNNGITFWKNISEIGRYDLASQNTV